jgi:quinol monooxygenase YgiN
MLLFRVHMRIGPVHRAAVMRSLLGMLQPARVMPGWVSNELCCDVEDLNMLVFTELWRDEATFAERLRSDDLRVLFAAMDCATKPPEVRIETVVDVRGMEFIVACRSGQAGVGADE